MSSLPTFALKSRSRIFIWYLGNFSNTFQFPVEAVLHLINFNNNKKNSTNINNTLIGMVLLVHYMIMEISWIISRE
jgi:hypothetical protein